MQDPILDLLGTTLVPELAADIAAGTAGNVHLVLIVIAALGADPLQYSWASLVAQTVKNLPAMWETWVRSLGWEDPLEKGKATHSSILGLP